MTVARLLRHEISNAITAREGDELLSVSRKLSDHDIGAVVVLDDDGGLAGIITERDVVRAVSQGQSEVFAIRAKDIMTRKVYVCRPDETEIQVMSYMTELGIRHMPVVDTGRVVGLVSILDVVRHRLVKIRHLIERVDNAPDDTERVGLFTRHLRNRGDPTHT